MAQKILIIDDEQPIRELLAQYLTACGYAVASAGTEIETLARVDEGSPDLVISDLQLEDTDGLEMIARLKERLPDVPVILLTGVLFDPEVARDVLHKHVACYLEKTSPLSRILETIRQLLERRQP
ncbi:MAG TPA: response regulator [Lacunisphaera sp.]|jgi:DNA-binding NtrC family response regulator|nr:response regulator [Lacunisphaera sp.]